MIGKKNEIIDIICWKLLYIDFCDIYFWYVLLFYSCCNVSCC